MLRSTLQSGALECGLNFSADEIIGFVEPANAVVVYGQPGRTNHDQHYANTAQLLLDGDDEILAGVNILDVSKYIFHAESVLQDVGKSASKTSLVVTAIVDEYSWQSSDLIGKQG